jgi:hypothetical protein
MSEILRSLAISSGILFPVVVLVIIASIAAVKRGEAAAHGLEPAPESGPVEKESGPGRAARRRFLPERDPNVLEILLLAVVLFTLTMGVFLGFSLLQQLF